MTDSLPPVLIVDDEKNMRLSLSSALEDEGYDVFLAESAEQGMRLLEANEVFMVLTDARLGGMSGYDFLAKVREKYPKVPVVVMTAYATPKLAAEAIKAGAMDYLAKPFAPEELLHAISRCAERYSLVRDNTSLRRQAGGQYRLEHIIGDSPAIVEMRKLIETVAPTHATVLILGESGTGKELIAGSIHTLSKRAESNYVRINCAAIPEALLESELFGHEKGAFTGALRLKLGRVEEADGGTLFLDEIGDMSRSLQAKLLRFLEDGTFTRVGGNEELQVGVRVIAATNRDIVEAIRSGEFREDLFHRLNVVQFFPPPLRDRGEDIILLADHFLKMFAEGAGKPKMSISAPARARLLQHHWPGNVRELRNVIERAVILQSGAELTVDSIPDFQVEARLRRDDAQQDSVPELGSRSLDEAVADFERVLLMRALEQNRYSFTKTADHLGISRHSLRYRMQRLNIDLDSDDDGKDGETESTGAKSN